MTGGIVPEALSNRDRAVVELVDRFRQLKASHIRTALFAGSGSKTSLDRTLKRLVERRYLARLARPVGGDGGGSSQYVYQLGRAGWRLLAKQGEYWIPRSVNLHTLAIADSFAGLKQAERGGKFTLIRFNPEPACHVSVGAIELTPDAYVEIGFREQNTKISLWLEIDRGTEKAEVIKEKCIRYWRAYQIWEHDTFPYVMFVVPDALRRRSIERVVMAGPDEAYELFRISESSSFVEFIHRNLR